MKKKLIVFVMAAVFLLSSATPAFATSVNDGWRGVMPLIQQGNSNGAVRGAQWLLKDDGRYHDTIDSIFGPNTKTAVKGYQKSKGITQDGVVGPITWGKMRTEIYYFSANATDWNYDHLYSYDRWRHRKVGGAWYIYTVKMCS
jgi:hypothetical protein